MANEVTRKKGGEILDATRILIGQAIGITGTPELRDQAQEKTESSEFKAAFARLTSEEQDEYKQILGLLAARKQAEADRTITQEGAGARAVETLPGSERGGTAPGTSGSDIEGFKAEIADAIKANERGGNKAVIKAMNDYNNSMLEYVQARKAKGDALADIKKGIEEINLQHKEKFNRQHTRMEGTKIIASWNDASNIKGFNDLAAELKERAQSINAELKVARNAGDASLATGPAPGAPSATPDRPKADNPAAAPSPPLAAPATPAAAIPSEKWDELETALTSKLVALRHANEGMPANVKLLRDNDFAAIRGEMEHMKRVVAATQPAELQTEGFKDAAEYLDKHIATLNDQAQKIETRVTLAERRMKEAATARAQAELKEMGFDPADSVHQKELDKRVRWLVDHAQEHAQQQAQEHAGSLPAAYAKAIKGGAPSAEPLHYAQAMEREAAITQAQEFIHKIDAASKTIEKAPNIDKTVAKAIIDHNTAMKAYVQARAEKGHDVADIEAGIAKMNEKYKRSLDPLGSAIEGTAIHHSNGALRNSETAKVVRSMTAELNAETKSIGSPQQDSAAKTAAAPGTKPPPLSTAMPDLHGAMEDYARVLEEGASANMLNAIQDHLSAWKQNAQKLQYADEDIIYREKARWEKNAEYAGEYLEVFKTAFHDNPQAWQQATGSPDSIVNRLIAGTIDADEIKRATDSLSGLIDQKAEQARPELQKAFNAYTDALGIKERAKELNKLFESWNELKNPQVIKEATKSFYEAARSAQAYRDAFHNAHPVNAAQAWDAELANHNSFASQLVRGGPDSTIIGKIAAAENEIYKAAAMLARSEMGIGDARKAVPPEKMDAFNQRVEALVTQAEHHASKMSAKNDSNPGAYNSWRRTPAGAYSLALDEQAKALTQQYQTREHGDALTKYLLAHSTLNADNATGLRAQMTKEIEVLNKEWGESRSENKSEITHKLADLGKARKQLDAFAAARIGAGTVTPNAAGKPEVGAKIERFTEVDGQKRAVLLVRDGDAMAARYADSGLAVEKGNKVIETVVASNTKAGSAPLERKTYEVSNTHGDIAVPVSGGKGPAATTVATR